MEIKRAEIAVYKKRAVNLAAGALAFGGALMSTGSEAANPDCRTHLNLSGLSGLPASAVSPEGTILATEAVIDGRRVLTFRRPSNDVVKTANGSVLDANKFKVRAGSKDREFVLACGLQADVDLSVGFPGSRPEAVTKVNTPAATNLTLEQKPAPTLTPDARAAAPSPTQDSSNSWLGFLLGGLGLAALAGVGVLAYRSRNRHPNHPNQPNNPNTQGVLVPVQFNVSPVVIDFTPHLQNPNNPNQAPVAPGAPTAPMPPAARRPRRPLPPTRTP